MSEAKRLKGLEDENSRLKKLLEEAMLDNAMCCGRWREKLLRPAARTRTVAHLRATFGGGEPVLS